MRLIRPSKMSWVLGSVGVLTAVGILLPTMILNATSAAAAGHHALSSRPHAVAAGATTDTQSYPPVAFSQEFTTNTKYFCPAGSGNAPCDGNPNGDYGTIDRVSGGFSNGGYGNYAPSTPALDSSGGYMAVVSGDADQNQGLDCPTPSGEYCTGPYALFGTGASKGVENKFPTGGFTVTADLYLSPSTAGSAATSDSDQLVDADVEVNLNTGSYGADEIITACYQSADSGFAISFGNSSPGSCSGTSYVTTDGWYRYVWDFSDNAGYPSIAEYVYSEGSSLALVASSGPQEIEAGGSQTRVGHWGGPGYFWLPTEDFAGLPLANFDLQTGVHTKGEAA